MFYTYLFVCCENKKIDKKQIKYDKSKIKEIEYTDNELYISYCVDCHNHAEPNNIKDKMNTYYLQNLINNNKFYFDRNIKPHLILDKNILDDKYLFRIKEYLKSLDYRILPGELVY